MLPHVISSKSNEAALAKMGALSHVTEEYRSVDAEPLKISEAEIHHGIASRFEFAASQFPNNVAIRYGQQSIKYDRLQTASNAVANWLLAKKAPLDVPIAIAIENPIFFAIAILGVWKAGGFYLPIPINDALFVNSMLREHSPPKMLIHSSEGYAFAAKFAESESIEEILSHGDGRHIESARHSPFAFVMYTSGSTGPQKGVVQRQKTLMHNLKYQSERQQITSCDRLTQLYPLGKMGAVRSLLNALLNGATLCPFDVAIENLARFEEWLADAQPSIFHCSASMFRAIATKLPAKAFAHIRLLILGGEVVYKSDYLLFKEKFEDRSLLCTGLGSTETPTVSMMFLPKSARVIDVDGRLPLGFIKPGVYMKARFLGDGPTEAAEHGRISVVGRLLGFMRPGVNIKARFLGNGPSEDAEHGRRSVVGRLEIESLWMFAGYWPVVANVSSAAESPQTYLSRDLVRIEPSGAMYYEGRDSNLLNIKGNLFKLSDIEIAVRNVPDVIDCAVLSHDDESGKPLIFVFAVESRRNSLSPIKIQYFLRDALPSFAQPFRISVLATLPRLRGDKVDVKKLRKLISRQAKKGGLDDFKSSLDESEQKMLACFENTSYPFLKNWVTYNTFDGGIGKLKIADLDIDSLSLLEIASNIEEKFKKNIDPRDLLRFKRIKDILLYVEQQ